MLEELLTLNLFGFFLIFSRIGTAIALMPGFSSVVTVSDPAASRQIVAQAKELNPGITVLARTRYASEIAPLHRLGSDHAVADEFEASLELGGRLMDLYGMDKEAIEDRKELIRQENYRLLIEEAGQKS